MKKPLFAIILAAASVLPLAVSAQTPPEGPPPEVRAQFEQLHATAKTNAFNALSADHRAKVQNIINQVNAGTLDRRSAAQQIDAVLSPTESQAVLNEGQKMRTAMRTYIQQHPPQTDGQAGPPRAFGNRDGNAQHARRTPDAGRVLLMLGANRPQRPPSQP